MSERDLPVRVMVQDAWIDIPLSVPANTTFADLKQQALTAAKVVRPVSEYVLKRMGAEVLDESQTLGRAGVTANAPFIVLPRLRRPVK